MKTTDIKRILTTPGAYGEIKIKLRDVVQTVGFKVSEYGSAHLEIKHKGKWRDDHHFCWITVRENINMHTTFGDDFFEKTIPAKNIQIVWACTKSEDLKQAA